jgi:hypothetical protein
MGESAPFTLFQMISPTNPSLTICLRIGGKSTMKVSFTGGVTK